MIRCIRGKDELAVIQQIRTSVIQHYIGFGKEPQKTIRYAQRICNTTRVLRASAAPAIQLMTFGMHSSYVCHTRCDWYLFRSKGSDQRVVNIDIDNAFTFQVQFIPVCARHNPSFIAGHFGAIIAKQCIGQGNRMQIRIRDFRKRGVKPSAPKCP